MLEHKQSGLKLRCWSYPIKESNSILLMASPVIGSFAELTQHQLSLTDIQSYETLVALLFSNQAVHAALHDSTHFSYMLKKKNSELDYLQKNLKAEVVEKTKDLASEVERYKQLNTSYVRKNEVIELSHDFIGSIDLAGNMIFLNL